MEDHELRAVCARLKSHLGRDVPEPVLALLCERGLVDAAVDSAPEPDVGFEDPVSVARDHLAMYDAGRDAARVEETRPAHLVPPGRWRAEEVPVAFDDYELERAVIAMTVADLQGANPLRRSQARYAVEGGGLEDVALAPRTDR